GPGPRWPAWPSWTGSRATGPWPTCARTTTRGRSRRRGSAGSWPAGPRSDVGRPAPARAAGEAQDPVGDLGHDGEQEPGALGQDSVVPGQADGDQRHADADPD